MYEISWKSKEGKQGRFGRYNRYVAEKIALQSNRYLKRSGIKCVAVRVPKVKQPNPEEG